MEVFLCSGYEHVHKNTSPQSPTLSVNIP